MTQDEIIEMAKEAGFYINDELTITSPFIEDICISPMLKQFAKLVAAKEREACAAVCERHAKVYSDLPKTLLTDVSWAACIDIRDSIQRRSEA